MRITENHTNAEEADDNISSLNENTSARKYSKEKIKRTSK